MVSEPSMAIKEEVAEPVQKHIQKYDEEEEYYLTPNDSPARQLLSGGGFGSEKKTDKSCLIWTVCNNIGHEAKSCFQVVGFLDWWFEKTKQQSNHGGSIRKRGGKRNRGGPAERGGRGRGSAQHVRASSSLRPRLENSFTSSRQTKITTGTALAVAGGVLAVQNLSSDQWQNLLKLVKNQTLEFAKPPTSFDRYLV
ncbi:hypothetical protein M9H77_24324 [Catharanthus roseus]|uniref:Uncharacterized protein n=1 Tax=Catharanthus roseus TaxID=4058 RepID=A0ACC0AWN9_CATRO|nr:hypothetical protein M9H77_24324 [Catharanthus roseus]